MKLRSFSQLRFGLAAALIALTAQVLLGRFVGRDSFQIFLAAVAVSAIRAGRRNGILTLTFSVLAKLLLFFFLIRHSARGEIDLFVDRMTTFILMGGTVCWIGGALQESALREKELLERARLLTGLLPICAGCKRIRDDRGRWCQMETYISARADVEFSHGFCPKCAAKALSELQIS
jgi:K+-sensing histidine kinase KdpD